MTKMKSLLVIYRCMTIDGRSEYTCNQVVTQNPPNIKGCTAILKQRDLQTANYMVPCFTTLTEVMHQI